MEKNPGRCLYYTGSVNQRKTERARGDGDRGTMGYAEDGCYECDGFKHKCPEYISLNTIRDLSR
jgi:hypothetical protein